MTKKIGKFNLKKSIRFEKVSFSYKIDPKNQKISS